MESREYIFLHEKIDDFKKGIEAQIQAKDDMIMMQLEKILEQTKITNGRVTKLEIETSVWRFFQNKPRLALCVIAGAFFISVMGFDYLLKLF